ncbi:hypothetical protein DL771_002528 [Monosporascus sp. 5C6A]|nr:hypothetical protein DL771_002528 [Monosporascus sp. 5C6A]
MREYASTLPMSGESFLIIRYTYHDGHTLEYEFATAIPFRRDSRKRTHDGNISCPDGHVRWVTTLVRQGQEYVLDLSRSHDIEQMGDDVFAVEEQMFTHMKDRDFKWLQPPEFFPSSDSMTFSNVDKNTLDSMTGMFLPKSDFKFLAGDPINCALFVSTGRRKYEQLRESVNLHKNVPRSAFEEALRSRLVSQHGILDHLQNCLGVIPQSSVLSSLRALATMTNIYKMLPNATVSLEVTSQTLCETPWAKAITANAEGTLTVKNARVRFSTLPMNWAKTFSCIAFFESGLFAIQPSSFTNVMAMSVGASIYIAVPLLCDPSEDPSPYEIRRIRGNIGKPGIAMLIPPRNPQIRKDDYSSWQLVTHAMFDGRSSDSFQGTSLHLSFTGCTFPIDVGSYGSRDSEIYFVESVISVHDKGKWVADLDILTHLQSSNVERIDNACPHNTTDAREKPYAVENSDFTMVDTWEEILDRAENMAIIRSAGNWVGRLPTASLRP